MYIPGPVLIGFSALCLAVSGLAYQAQQRQELIANLTDTPGSRFEHCQDNGVDTPFGRLGCIQTTSGSFSDGEPKGLRTQRGGGTFILNW